MEQIKGQRDNADIIVRLFTTKSHTVT